MNSWYVLREKVCYLNKKQTFSIIDIAKSETPLHLLIAYSGCNLFFLPKFGLIMAKEKHKTFLLSVAGQWVENFSKDLRSIFIFYLLTDIARKFLDPWNTSWFMNICKDTYVVCTPLENISPHFVGLGCKPTSYLVFQFQTRLKMSGNHAIGTVLKIGSKQWKNKLGFFRENLRISKLQMPNFVLTIFHDICS